MQGRQSITIKTPGRICLFGDHQDYLGLPVIACAFNRQLSLTAEENGTSFIRLSLPDIKNEKAFDTSRATKKSMRGDFFSAAIHCVNKRGIRINRGYDVKINGNIPVNAGVSSSSAIVVAWVHFLLKAFGNGESISPETIAQIAYEAEVVEQQAPGGKMDQFTIAIGNLVYIETKENGKIESLSNSLNHLILGESGLTKETLGVLGSTRTKTEEAIAFVKKVHPHFQLQSATPNDIEFFAKSLPKKSLPYLKAAILNHDITKRAYTQLKQEVPNKKELGIFMCTHHEILRNHLKLTVPRIDDMIEAAIGAGAYGAKIVGSGVGGSIVALSSSEKVTAVIRAIKQAGGKDAYAVEVTQGSHCL